MAEVSPPLYLNVDDNYGADELGLPYRDLIPEGVMGYGDLRVSQRGLGANMTVDVAAGTAWIMGDAALTQPQYRCYNDAVVNLAIGTAHATLPRIDMIVAEVLDSTFAGVSDLWRLRVIAGTASAGATLANRTGAATLPASAIRLADVFVAAAASSILDAAIRDRRPFATKGIAAPVVTALDWAYFDVPPYVPATGGGSGACGKVAASGAQIAGLVFLERRIVGATRIRFRYNQSAATPHAGSYVLGIYDASGLRIVDTGAVAFTGTASSTQVRSETIAATTLDPGAYYLLYGYTMSAGSDNSSMPGWAYESWPRPNHLLWSASGGTSAPLTLNGFTDYYTTAAASSFPVTPMVWLSVG